MMDKLQQIAFDLDFNSHKMDLNETKRKLAELISELEKENIGSKIISKFKFIYSILTENNYKDIL